MVSEICEAFGCAPDEAERQDMTKVRAIFDYRNAKAAIELFNKGDEGREELAKQPALTELLLAMKRARGY